MEVKHDVFISYKSEDRAWAERLEKELQAVGLRVFFDRNPTVGINAGREWVEELKAALNASGALVALYSELAAARLEWNERERYIFEQAEFLSPIPQGRPIIHIRLDNAKPPLSEIQAIEELKAYPAPDAAPALTWKTVALRVKRAARRDGVVSVDTLVLAATRREIEGLGNGPAGEDLRELADQLGVGGNLLDRYGEGRWDWRPYGEQSVKDMLTALELKAGDRPKVNLKFDRTDDGIWSASHDVAESAARQLASTLALILIDPLSLYVRAIQSRMGFLWRFQESPTNAIAVLAPLSTNDGPLNFLVETYSGELYRNFMMPPRPPIPKAPVGMHLRTADELLRIMLLAHASGSPGSGGPGSGPPRRNGMTAMGST